MKKYVVSACLAGVRCRYDCKANEQNEITELVKSGLAIPVCPEQLGGLSTPRPPAEIINNKVINNLKQDVTKEYEQGANEALKIATLFGAKEAILKSRSPMCGCGEIYDGTFTKTLKSGDGVFAALLKKSGIKISTK